MNTRLIRLSHVSIVLAVFALAGWASSAASATTYDLGSPSPASITTTTGTVTVPINLTGFTPAGAGARAFRVSFKISAGLRYVPAQGSAITAGPYMTNVDPGATVLFFSQNADGSVTWDGFLTVPFTGPCATAASGTVFNLVLGTTRTTGVSTEAVDFAVISTQSPPSPSLRSCDNATNLPITYGQVHQDIPVILCPPVPPRITDLVAAPVKSGNPSTNPAGIAGIKLQWTSPAGATTARTVDVWRAPFGFEQPAGTWVNTYPEYEDDNPTLAQVPATPTGSCPVNLVGWTRAASFAETTGTQTHTDKPPVRGFWYYVVCLTDACNNGPVSNMTFGTLDYLLGDVTSAANPNVGDNKVDAADQSLLGVHYGIDLDAAGNSVWNQLDFGPTTSFTVDGRPRPDDLIAFEELMIFSLNFNRGPAPQFASVPAAADRDELTLEAPASVQAGQPFSVLLNLKAAGDLHGISAQLGWDAAVAQPLSVESGPLAEAQDGMVLSGNPGKVDAAVMGADRPGFSGDGVLATVHFRASATGNPAIRIANLDARDQSNRKVELSAGAPGTALPTAFAPVSPNPFKGDAMLAFSLAKGGRIELTIYSVDGRPVRTLASGARAAGAYRLAWDGTDDGGRMVKPGMFFARLTTPEGRFTRTLVRLR